MMGPRGKGRAHIGDYPKNHQKLRELFIQSSHLGMTKTELWKGSGLTRPTVDNHLKQFLADKEISKEGRRYILKKSKDFAEVMQTIMLEEAHEFSLGIKEMIRKEVKYVYAQTTEHEFQRTVDFELQQFLNTHCITFIGKHAGAFPKTMEGMKERLCFEKLLHQRHETELAPFKEQYRHARSNEERIRIDEKIKKEVGWKVGDWITIQLKKTEGLRSYERLFRLVGLDENQPKNARALKMDRKA